MFAVAILSGPRFSHLSFSLFPFFLFYTSYDREVCVGGVASEEHFAGADRMGSLFEDTLHIYGGIFGNFMIYAYSVFRCSLFFGFVGCSWVDRSLACTHIYPLRNLSASV